MPFPQFGQPDNASPSIAVVWQWGRDSIRLKENHKQEYGKRVSEENLKQDYDWF